MTLCWEFQGCPHQLLFTNLISSIWESLINVYLQYFVKNSKSTLDLISLLSFYSKVSLDIQILDFCVQLVVINVHVDQPLKKENNGKQI